MAHVKMYTASGEEHGLLDTLTNSVSSDHMEQHLKGEAKKKIKEQRAHDAKMVKAEYMNRRGLHERLEMHYCKYAGDPIQVWRFIPGQVYEVPLGLIEQINDSSKHLAKRAGLLSVDGAPVRKDENPLQKDEPGDWLHKFVPVGFS